MVKIRVLVVEDHTVMREGVVSLLSLQPDIEVVGQAGDGIVAVEKAVQTQPDVILLDMVMPHQDGLMTIPKLKEVIPTARILVLTGFSEGERVYQAIQAGARGYLLKDSTREQLVQAIRDVVAGKIAMTPSIAMKVIQELNHPSKAKPTEEPLTLREVEVLKLIARGMSNQDIGDTLFVHERTIAKYVSSILDKIQVANRTQAALWALREGYANIDEYEDNGDKEDNGNDESGSKKKSGK